MHSQVRQVKHEGFFHRVTPNPLAYDQACIIQPPNYRTLVLHLIGCGGTGSALAGHLCRIARVLREMGRDVELVFVDGDVVEHENVYRQSFTDGEVGYNKALALALRYTLAWGLPIHALPYALPAHYVAPDGSCAYVPSLAHPPYGGDTHDRLANAVHVFIGCVDNPAARLAIATCLDRDEGDEAANRYRWRLHTYQMRGNFTDLERVGEWLEHPEQGEHADHLGTFAPPLIPAPRIWWLDCGNEATSGQIVLGAARRMEQLKFAFVTPGHCLMPPSVALLHPDLVPDPAHPVDPIDPIDPIDLIDAVMDRDQRTTPEAVDESSTRAARATRASRDTTQTSTEPRHAADVAGSETDEQHQTIMSCAHVALTNPQSLLINHAIAAHAAHMLVEFLLTNNLKRFATYVDLPSGSVRSKYCTPAELAGALSRPATMFVAPAEAAPAPHHPRNSQRRRRRTQRTPTTQPTPTREGH